MPRAANETKPSQFRLSDDTLATVDALAKELGLTSRAEVLRVAVARMAKDVLSKMAKKTSKKTA